MTRDARAENAKAQIDGHFTDKQKAFLDFVLSHYVSVGVEELDQEKLRPLLELRYGGSLHDALAELGRAEEVGRMFSGFQRYLYQVGASR